MARNMSNNYGRNIPQFGATMSMGCCMPRVYCKLHQQLCRRMTPLTLNHADNFIADKSTAVSFRLQKGKYIFNFLGFCLQLFGMSLKITFVNFLSNWYHPEGPHRAKNHWFYLSSCFHFCWGGGGEVRMILWLFWKESNIIENQVLQEIPRY